MASFRHRCSECKRFVSDVVVRANDERMTECSGICAVHGRVDCSRESWDWDLYEWEEEPCPA